MSLNARSNIIQINGIATNTYILIDVELIGSIRHYMYVLSIIGVMCVYDLVINVICVIKVLDVIES